MHVSTKQKYIESISLIFTLVGMAICLAAISWKAIDIYGTILDMRWPRLLQELFTSELSSMILLTCFWIGSLWRLARIRQNRTWHNRYINSGPTTIRLRSWLVALLAWAATSVALIAITNTSAALVLIGSLLVFGIPSWILERSLYPK